MTTNKHYTLFCNGCETDFIDSRDGHTAGETSDEIRDLAIDHGWTCSVGNDHKNLMDYCKKCSEKINA